MVTYLNNYAFYTYDLLLFNIIIIVIGAFMFVTMFSVTVNNCVLGTNQVLFFLEQGVYRCNKFLFVKDLEMHDRM
jgi:hypothetical protein